MNNQHPFIDFLQIFESELIKRVGQIKEYGWENLIGTDVWDTSFRTASFRTMPQIVFLRESLDLHISNYMDRWIIDCIKALKGTDTDKSNEKGAKKPSGNTSADKEKEEEEDEGCCTCTASGPKTCVILNWTEDEVNCAKAIKLLYPDVDTIDKIGPEVRIWRGYSLVCHLNANLFPSISKDGEPIALDDVINYEAPGGIPVTLTKEDIQFIKAMQSACSGTLYFHRSKSDRLYWYTTNMESRDCVLPYKMLSGVPTDTTICAKDYI